MYFCVVSYFKIVHFNTGPEELKGFANNPAVKEALLLQYLACILFDQIITNQVTGCSA